MRTHDAGSRFPASLSVFFPAFNDAPVLPSLVQSTFTVLEAHATEFEVIVINDGSRDDTAAVLKSLEQRYGNRLRVVTHQSNRGYGAALRSGFAHATGEYVFYTDGDGQYDVRDIPLLLERAGRSQGWVNGFKSVRQDPPYRLLIGAVYRRFVRLLFDLHLHDIDCDFRLIRRDLLVQCTLTSTSGTICVELVRGLEHQGVRAVEVGVRHYRRTHGRSQFFRPLPLLRTLYQLLSLYRRLMVPGPRVQV
jgi:glycosyltransferase involved in cell wall biosynthesis